MTQPPGVGEPGGPRGIDTSSPAGPPAPDQPTNPFQAPPPGYQPPAPPAAPPAYGPPPGWAPPPQQQKTSGLAIASLVLALVGFGLIGLILGIVALVQIPKRGQKGTALAWIGIVLSVLSMIAAAVIGFAVYDAVKDGLPAQRDANGQVTAPADAGLADAGLAAGDCVTGLSESTDAAPKVVPCDGAYDAEVFDTFELPAGDYPGTTALQKQADEGCTTRFEQSGATADEQSQIWYLYPSTKLTWQLGDRTIVCLTAPSGP